MTEPRSAYYVLIYTMVREVCIENGYAAAVHGSLVNDLDVVAVPWTKDACRAESLVSKICERLQKFVTFQDEKPEEKPHGRVAWCIGLDGGASLDLSVSPKLVKQPPKG